MPTPRPDDRVLARRLGLALGPTLSALVDRAYQLDPRAPEDAFAALFFLLDWIGPQDFDIEELRVPGMTPPNVLPFGRTGGDLHHFGFLMDDPALPTDERPVVYIAKDVPAAHVVAPNLVGFLSLVAWGGASWIDRAQLPERGGLLVYRARCDDPEDGGEPFRRASEALCSIPGVAIPDHPRAIAEILPDRAFTYPEPPAPPPRRIDFAAMPPPRDGDDAISRAEWAIREGALDVALALVRRTFERADLERRAHYLVLDQLAAANRTAEARSELPRMLDAWEARSFIHPGEWDRLLERMRRIGGVDDALFQRVKHGRARSAAQR
jgi:hypothetical protein